MKRVSALILLFQLGICFAANTIIAIVNEEVITIQSIEQQLNDSMHLFGGLDRTTSTGVTNAETTGIAYESCCWALRLAHFKEDNGAGGYNYSTGVELVLSGLGSTSSPLKDRIEANIPDYNANLRYKP